MPSMGRKIETKVLSPKVITSVGELYYRGKNRFSGHRPVGFLQAKRILVLRVDKIGDVVITSAFLRELRRNVPDARISLVVNPGVYNLVEYCPYVDEVFAFDWESYREKSLARRHLHALRYARKHLWPGNHDLTVVPRWDADFYHENYLAYYSGALRRIAHTEKTTPSKSQLNAGEDRLFTHIIKDYALQHEVEHDLYVIRFLGGSIRENHLELWPAPGDELFVEMLMQSQGVHRNGPLIGIGIGAGDPKRIWPTERYIEVVRWLVRQHHARIVVVGTAAEKAQGRRLVEQCGGRVVNTIGKSTLRQTGALLKRCDLYLGNDSGPMHMAAAGGAPVVEISAHPGEGAPDHYNSPVRFGPWQVPHRILQPESAQEPCTDACSAPEAHCIRQITVRQVQAAVRSLLSVGRDSSRNTSFDTSRPRANPER